MDVLSDVIRVARAGAPHSARVTRRAPYGRRLPGVDGAAFHVVLTGTSWFVPTNSAPILMAPGDVIFLPHGAEHALTDDPHRPITGMAESLLTVEDDPVSAADDGTTTMLCGAYLLDRSMSHPLLSELPAVIHLPATVGSSSMLRSAVDLLGAELRTQNRAGSGAVVPALIDVLLAYILRTWFESRDESRWAAALRDPSISAALAAIHQEPGHQWTVDELAGLAGRSRAAFARRFADQIGQPPLGYLTWWRMITAARLLRDSELTIDAIAQRVGYTSQFAFSNAFKRKFGHAPGGYRQLINAVGTDRRELLTAT